MFVDVERPWTLIAQTRPCVAVVLGKIQLGSNLYLVILPLLDEFATSLTVSIGSIRCVARSLSWDPCMICDHERDCKRTYQRLTGVLQKLSSLDRFPSIV